MGKPSPARAVQSQKRVEVKFLMDAEQKARFEYFRHYVGLESLGLEIGPLTRPTFSKALGFNVHTLDHASTEALREKYRDHPTIDIDAIDHVDWVWPGGAYSDIPGIPQNFDFIVSCHSIEHSTDLVQFLADLSTLLSKDGLLFLVVPSRDKMFDFFRPLTTLGDVIMGHHYPAALDMKARIDELELACALDGQICWSEGEGHVAQIRGKRPHPIRQADFIYSELEHVAQWRNETDYRDGHRWVFQPESLTMLISSLSQLGMCDFEVRDFKPGVGCEFMMVLAKSDIPTQIPQAQRRDYYSALVPASAARTGLFLLTNADKLFALIKALLLRTRRLGGRVLRMLRLR